MVALGACVIPTVAVALTDAQPLAAATVYVTVYVPDVLDDGVTAPVVALIVKVDGALYVPPDVPLRVTD